VHRRTYRHAALIVALVTPLLSGCVVAAGTSDGSGAGFVFLLLPVAVFAILFVFLSRGRRRQSHWSRVERSEEPDAHLIRAELSVLADDVIRLEPQVTMCEAARNDYEAATHRYRVAQAAMDHADDPVDLRRVQRVVDEATWSMARARATLEGRPPPEPSPTLRRRGPAGEPAVRVDDRGEPVYVGTPATFSSGWFGGGGFFGNLLLGSMLGGFGGWMVTETTDDDGDSTDVGRLDEE
jgi:hypothetical protein